MCVLCLVEVAWDEAERVSWLSGHPFNDRNGIRRNVDGEKLGVVEIALRRWCHGKGLDYVRGKM